MSGVALLGAAPPSILVEPKGSRDSAWAEVVDLMAAYDFQLDDWQELILQVALCERTDGKWAAKQVGLSIPRQNGKSQMIVARALAGALLLGEKKIVVSAHLTDTARETFGKFMDLIEASPSLEAKLRGGSIEKGVMNAIQREQITFANGAKILFKARTKAGNRGFSSDLLFIDEAQRLDPAAWVSINSTMSARPNPQIWLMGTPPTPEDQGATFEKIRETAMSGNSTSLAWLEWSADPGDDPALESTRRKANPAWDTRINHDVVQGEYESYSEDEFAIDRLGIWMKGGSMPRVIKAARWNELAVPDEAVPSLGNIAYGVKFSADGSRFGVSVALAHAGGVHVEAFAPTPMGAGLTGLADWLAERWRDCVGIVIDGKAGVGDLVNLLKADGRRVPDQRITVVTMDQAVAANQTFVRHTVEGTLSHPGQPGLDEAIGLAAKRDIGIYGGWGFQSATPDGDVTPVDSSALAVYGAVTAVKKIPTATAVTGQGRTMGSGRTMGNGRRRGGNR